MEIFNAIFTGLLILSFVKGKNKDYLSLDTCNRLKGISILAVFIGHTSKIFTGLILYKFYCSIGLFAVSLFFFISGYGLMTGYIKKDNYQVAFVKRRIIPVLVCYFLVCCVHTVLNGRLKLSLSNLILCNYVPYSWFIFSIIALYLMFYVSMLMCKKNIIGIISMTSVLLFLYVIIASCIDAPYPLMGGLQMVTFVVGMLIAVYPNKLRMIMYRKSLVVTVFLVSWAMSLTSKYFGLPLSINVFNECLQSYLFPFVTFSLLSYFTLSRFSVFWLFLQRYSLQVYLIHGVLLSAMKSLAIYSEVLVFFVFALTLLFAAVLNKITNFMVKYI